MRPHKQWQSEPGHPWGPHRVDRYQEVQTRQDRRKSSDEDAHNRGRHRRVRIDRAQRRVERPARVQPAGHHRPQRERTAHYIHVPAQQVDLGKRQVLRPDHQRYQEIAKHRRHRRNQEEEDHRHAVHREHAVVLIRREHVPVRGHQVQADHHGEKSADEKEERYGRQIQQRNPFVVRRQQPRTDPVRLVQIISLRIHRRRSHHSGTHTISSPLAKALCPRPWPEQVAIAET